MRQTNNANECTIHELSAKRFSPRAFAETPAGTETLHTLMEAARGTNRCFPH